MKIVQLVAIFSVLFASAALADTVTVFDSPAGIYDALYAKLAVDQQSGRAYIKLFLMDERSHGQCWGNQAAMQGISTDNCRVHTQRISVPGLAYNDASQSVTYKGESVHQDSLKTDMHYAQVDDGTRVNSVKYARVRLQTK